MELAPFAVAGAIAPVSAEAASRLPKSIDVLPGARIFRVGAHGARIVGADIGPTDGAPILLVPGFASDFPYLSPFVNLLAHQGCRIFVYNPPGQGSGALESVGPANSGSMAGLVQTVLDIHAYIRGQTGGKPVTWVGHSMGGMEIRMASASVAPSEIRALVTLFSPSLKFAKTNFNDPVLGYERLLDEQIFSNELINQWTLGAYDFWRLENAKALFVSEQNGSLKGLLGAPNPDAEALKKNAAYFIDWKAAPEIINDLESYTFETQAQDWASRDLSQLFVVSFSGNLDGVISSDDIIREAKAMNYPNVPLPVGHVGGFYDTKITPRLANWVDDIAHARLTKSNWETQ